MSQFDPQQFLNATFEGTNSTRVDPAPAGEHIFQIQDAPAFESHEIKKGERMGQMLYKAIFQLRLEAPGQPQDGKKVRHDLILDLTPTGGLDMGPEKNIGLGRMREACDLNRPGVPFSFNMFQGKRIRALVEHDVDSRDGVTVYPRIKRVSAV